MDPIKQQKLAEDLMRAYERACLELGKEIGAKVTVFDRDRIEVVDLPEDWDLGRFTSEAWERAGRDVAVS
jgi:hypothetical protein